MHKYLSSTELNKDVRDMKIETAHRVPSRSSPRPFIVKLSLFKDRELVLSDEGYQSAEKLVSIFEKLSCK